MRLEGLMLEQVRTYLAGKPVIKAYVFGSFARGEADEKSDLDLLVELDHSKPIGWDFFGWMDDLEEIVERKVDLVTPGGLSRHIVKFVERDKQLIYARPES